MKTRKAIPQVVVGRSTQAIAHGVAAALATLGLLAAGAAHADSLRLASTPAPPAYRDECSSCHMAYPPGLLPAASWQRLMGQLRTHFGADASVEPAARAAITAWLVANAATGKRASGDVPQDRISRSTWFVREHREIDSAVWSRAGIRSAANCAACHPKAEQGDFNEHDIRIPR